MEPKVFGTGTLQPIDYCVALAEGRIEYPGQIHAFVSLTKAIPQGLACTAEIGDFLRQRLATAALPSGDPTAG